MINREVGMVLQKRYRIVAKLGQGGMGAVYKAEDVRFNNAPVAIKETSAKNRVERRLFEREAAILHKLCHRALPRVWDYFAEENGQFLVMDFIEGESLDKVLEKQKAELDYTQVMGWADVLLDTLAYIHAQDPLVIHRDIKPANIRLTRSGEIFLLDFGLARDTLEPSDMTKNCRLGTRAYASPEQLRRLRQDEYVDAQSDLYALGATLYHLLTGQPPIESPTREQRLFHSMSDPLHATHEINPQIPLALSHVVVQAMAVERTRRFASATQMRDALQQARDRISRQQWEEAEAARLREEAQQRRTEELRPQEAEEECRRAESARRLAEQQRPAEETRQRAAAKTEPMQPEESERQQKEAAERRQQEAERKQREEAEHQRKEKAERQQREEAERKQKEQAERQQRAEAARREQEAVERRQREEAARQQKEAAERPQRSEAERQQRAARERELAEQRLAMLMVMPGLQSFEFETVKLDKNGKELERRKGQAHRFVEDLGNGVRLEMIEIPGGRFQMGSPANEANRSSNEGPQHAVNVPSFWMGQFEVTQAQWRAVMGSLPDVSFKDDELPVERVSWNDAQEFLKKLNGRANLQGINYRLPSEAEWEYAARAGTTTPFPFGETITPQFVNYHGGYPYANAPKGLDRQKTIPVGSLGVANAFGLFDMHGNVWEWCQDVWHSDYKGAPLDGSTWLSGGDSNLRVLRGGSWVVNGYYCRSANRSHYTADLRSVVIGFRVAVSSRTQ